MHQSESADMPLSRCIFTHVLYVVQVLSNPQPVLRVIPPTWHPSREASADREAPFLMSPCSHVVTVSTGTSNSEVLTACHSTMAGPSSAFDGIQGGAKRCMLCSDEQSQSGHSSKQKGGSSRQAAVSAFNSWRPVQAAWQHPAGQAATRRLHAACWKQFPCGKPDTP